MARNYSDNFTDLAQPQTAVQAGQPRVSASKAHGRYRYRRAVITAPINSIDDEVRLMSLKSGDRLVQLFVTSDGGSTAGAMDIGLYKAGANHDGAEIDDNVYASALATSAAIARVDEFTEAGTLGDADRGTTLWEQADTGGATYTTDPFELWDIVGTMTTGNTVAATVLVVEAYYVSGD